MPETHPIPRKVQEQIIESHGTDTTKWNQELRDLFDPTISARQLNPPMSGQILKVKDQGFHFHWAKDVCGANPDHSRVEELRFMGYDYATTDDVDMCSEDTVKNRNGKGFSNEIRSGDRRLMKLPMQKYREMRKAQNLTAYQMAYPQAFGGDVSPLSTEVLNGRATGTRLMDAAETESVRAQMGGETSTASVKRS